jgi:hypothetical protein
VDGRIARTLTTNWQRNDLHAFGTAAFGFVTLTPVLTPGFHIVSLYGVDDKTGVPVLLSVRQVYQPVGYNRQPVGAIDTVNETTVSGWAVDPDFAGPAVVVVDVDGQAVSAAYASNNRSDLNGYVGSIAHGFSFSLNTLAAGAHTIKVVVLDMQTGAMITLASKSITVNAPPPPDTPPADPNPPADPGSTDPGSDDPGMIDPGSDTPPLVP